jgi:hypothetical protein
MVPTRDARLRFGMSAGRNDPVPAGRQEVQALLRRCRARSPKAIGAAPTRSPGGGGSEASGRRTRSLLIRVDRGDAHRQSCCSSRRATSFSITICAAAGGEIADVAAAIERAVVASAREFGVLPERVRDAPADVAGALAPRLAVRRWMSRSERSFIFRRRHARSRKRSEDAASGRPYRGAKLARLAAAGAHGRARIRGGGALPGGAVAGRVELQAPRAALPSGRGVDVRLARRWRRGVRASPVLGCRGLFEGVAMQEEGEVFDRIARRLVSLVFDRARDVRPPRIAGGGVGAGRSRDPTRTRSSHDREHAGWGVTGTDVEDLVVLLECGAGLRGGASPGIDSGAASASASRGVDPRGDRRRLPLRRRGWRWRSGWQKGRATASSREANERVQELTVAYNAAPRGARRPVP